MPEHHGHSEAGERRRFPKPAPPRLNWQPSYEEPNFHDTKPSQDEFKALAEANRKVDAQLAKDHAAANKRLDELHTVLNIIVAELELRRQDAKQVDKWRNDYLRFIQETSMSPMILGGFEKHLSQVLTQVKNGVNLYSGFFGFTYGFLPQVEFEREFSTEPRPIVLRTWGRIWRFELQHRLETLVQPGVAPAELAGSLLHYIEGTLKQIVPENLESLTRNGWLKRYHEVLVLESLARAGEPVIDGDATYTANPIYNDAAVYPLFERPAIEERIKQYKVPVSLQHMRHIPTTANQLRKFHPIGRRELDNAHSF